MIFSSQQIIEFLVQLNFSSQINFSQKKPKNYAIIMQHSTGHPVETGLKQMLKK